MEKCLICGRLDAESIHENIRILNVNCPACGFYSITQQAKFTVERFKADKHTLSGLTRQAYEAGNHITITTENFQQLIDSAPKFESPLEIINMTLLMVMKRQNRADEYVQFTPVKDYPLIFAHDSREFSYILQTLIDQKLLEPYVPANTDLVRLTPEGWRTGLELQKTQRNSNQAFVAMSFDKELLNVWEDGIEPALKSTGFKGYRVDQEEYNEKIDDRIISGIRQSGLLVADFTQHKHGVYFEAGFAMGLGIPVIWTCKDTDIEKAHFDTRQYNHVTWSNPEELKEKLTLRISATIPGR